MNKSHYIWGNRLGVTHRWQDTGSGYEALCGLAMPADAAPDGDDGSTGDVRICPVCDPAAAAPPIAQAAQSTLPVWVSVDLIDDNPYQPRHEYREEDLTQLVDSIRRYGLLQTPLSRLVDLNGHSLNTSPSLVLDPSAPTARAEIAFGHRRLRAFRRLAEQDRTFAQMPLLFRTMDDETMAAHAWSENRDRSDLSAWEEAKAIEKRMQGFGWTQSEAAKKMGMDRSTISNKLRLLRLPAAQQRELHAGALSERQALALVPLLDLPETAQGAAGWDGPATILAQAKDQNSDQLRRQVETAMTRYSLRLDHAPFTAVVIDGDVGEVVCRICTACPERIKYSGVYRCPNTECYETKMAWWVKRRLEEAHAATGLPVGGMLAALEYGAHEGFALEREHLQAIRETGCDRANLKLFYRGEKERLRYCAPEGHPQVVIICDHGSRKRCACLARRKAHENQHLANAERQRKQKVAAILAPAREAVLAGLRAQHIEVWRVLAAQLCFDQKGKIEKAATIAEIEDIIVSRIFGRMPGVLWNAADDPEQAQQSVARILDLLGVCAQTPEPEPDVCTQTPPIDRATVLSLKKRVLAVGGTWCKYLPISGFFASFPGVYQACYPTVEELETVLQRMEQVHKAEAAV